MTSHTLMELAAQSLYLMLLLSFPVLLASLAIGITVGVVQAATQVQEQTLSFVPKLVGVSLVLAMTFGWMAHELVRFTVALWANMPAMVH